MLRRVPSHMAHNVSLLLLDAEGHFATAYLAPQRRPKVVRERVVTNHQRDLEWSEFAEVTRSAARHRFLTDSLAKARSSDRFVTRFLELPFYADDHEAGYGPLYTVVYRPTEGSADFLCPSPG